MPVLKIELDVGAQDPEPFEESLFAAGAMAVTLADAADDPVLEPKPGTTPLWPTVRIEALFPDDTDVDATLATLLTSIGGALTLPPHRCSLLEDRVWEREWLKDFRPMRFGRRLWICPGGQRPDGTALESGIDPVIIELDPGLAFGTGTHATTALCLEWLDGADLAGANVIDYGCGSGILAVAALRLGAENALGIDIDPQALLASHENAQRNGVAARLRLQAHDKPMMFKGNIVLANILAEPLHELAGELASHVAPGGWIVLSGILAAQAEAVAASYAPWFDIGHPIFREGWARLDGRRRS